MKIRTLLWALSGTLTLDVLAFSPQEVKKHLPALLKKPHDECECASTEAESSFLQMRKKGLDCDCRNTNPSDPPPSAGKVKEILYAHECDLANTDVSYWRLKKTLINPNGLVLKESTAYALDCQDCAQHNLACRPLVAIESGSCGCLWRVDGADAILEKVSCLNCASQCIGKEEYFDTGKEFEPAMTRGLCIRKKGYDIR